MQIKREVELLITFVVQSFLYTYFLSAEVLNSPSPSCYLQAAMLQYADRYGLLKAGDRVLAAVSGGVDSMVMLRLLHDAGVDAAVAHCNFGLRGDASDLDEALVKAAADRYGTACFAEHFDTARYAAENGISIQMAARKLRYDWFAELAAHGEYHAIAIAHNRDDRIETLLINVARGTGIRGLTGIRPRSGNVIRPLLFASRREIEACAEELGVAFREDASNATDKYVRNYIRHHVIPGMEQFFPAFRQRAERSMDHLADAALFYSDAIERGRDQTVSTSGDVLLVHLPQLLKSPSPRTLLYEILKPYGFPGTVAAEVLREHVQQSGRQFLSDGFRAVCDRQVLSVQRREAAPSGESPVDERTLYVEAPVQIMISRFTRTPAFMPDANPNVACLDDDMLQYPLVLRTWKHGDTFRPLGMKGMKKLSNFFIDRKVCIVEKERKCVLVSGGKIAWVVGMRIDDRFKITGHTKKIVKFELC